MSDTFFHVDRRDSLAAGGTIELEPVPDPPREGGSLLTELYPEGLSEHGRHYCTQDLYDDDSDDLWDVSCELAFELVRTARYPERPSRFQSAFGFRTLEAAERFVDRFADEPCAVWSVRADRSFVGDMGLVDAEDLANGFHNARYYWTGRSFRDDPLWEVLLVPPVEVVEQVGEVGSD